jgi:signal transduction histidine kinase/ActR/RegA family two-component response regulator/HPt (histidine-containing phosphotransfer) domain-containing protein
LEVAYLLDSLQKLNSTDSVLIKTSDSLKSIFGEYKRVLVEYARVSSAEINPDFERIQRVVRSDDEQPVRVTIMDSVRIENDKEKEEEKVGLIKRIFGKKNKKEEETEEIAQQDSIVIDSTEFVVSNDSILEKSRVLGNIETVIDSLQAEFSYLTRETLARESKLSKELSSLQLLIYEYLTFIESRELTKTKLEAVEAESQLAETRKQVSQFSFVIGALTFVVFVGLIIFLQQNQRFQRLLMLARKRAEEYARSKQLFLANMSHEIRTPMNAIVGFTEQLRKSSLSPDQSEKVDIIHQSSDHLLHLLNDILDISRFQNHTITLERESFDIKELFSDAIKLMKGRAEEKKIKLLYDVESISVDRLYGDPYRLRQVVLNLLSNSIKFTDKGGVKLAAKTYLGRGKKAKVVLSVVDTGIGIPDAKKKSIFNAFEQLETSEKTSGSGLGLSIVKYIVDLHGGAIDLRSEEGKGTKIKITLPMEVADEDVLDASSAGVDQAEIKRDLTILIADDEAFNRKLLQEILKPLDCQMHMAENGEQAFELLQNERFDIAFLDIKMPLMTGNEVLHYYRHFENANEETKFVAVTATTSDQRINLSAFDVKVTKPYKEEDVLNILREYFPADPTAVLSKNGYTNGFGQEISIDALSGIGDEEFVRDMLETFVESTSKHLDQVEELVKQENFTETAEVIHKIVGPARHLETKKFLNHLLVVEDKALKEKNVTVDEIETLRSEFDNLSESIKKYLETNE